MAYLILVATIPAGLIGFFFESLFKKTVRSPWVVVTNLVLVGALFIVGEAVGLQRWQASKLSFREAVGIGLAQAALVSGISRSGATSSWGFFWACAGTRPPGFPS